MSKQLTKLNENSNRLALWCFLIASLYLASALAASASPVGLWSRTGENGESHIRIALQGSIYTGTIDWMENPRNDTENPDTALQGRPLVGVQIFTSTEEISPTKWEGMLYNPEDGRTYNGSLEQTSANTLELEGCVLVVFCRSDTWTRLE